MFRDREEIRRRIEELVEKFRQKGATTPEKALTPQELGLPPRFEQAMQRRLGQTGIFVEVNGKYYLNEARLKQIQEQRGMGGGGGGGSTGSPRRTFMALRLARFAVSLLLVTLVIANVFIQSWDLRFATIGFFAVWIALFVAFAYYKSKVRHKFAYARGF